jgi:cytochrome c oxidase assembly protein subunit 11
MEPEAPLPNNVPGPAAKAVNRHLLTKLVVVALAMFGFGYALVPIYKKICEVTGINVLTNKDAGVEAFAKNTQVDRTRLVTIEFDANANGPWRFRPVKASMQVHPGALSTIVYEVANQQPRAMAGQAIPSYAPMQAGPHFKKMECFCFREQKLGPNEARQFPVVFVVDPKLPKDVTTITLSYTFFEVGGQSAATAAGR